MNLKNQFLKIYQMFFSNKELLGENGALLTVSVEAVSTEQELFGPFRMQAEKQLAQIVNLFLGGRDVLTDDLLQIADYVAVQYKDQEYWRDLLLDYLAHLVEKERLEILEEEKKLLADSKASLKEILMIEAKEKKVVTQFAEKIKKEGFKVDATLLVSNYLKMMRQDPAEAWRVLTTNPALFAPILVKDAKGKVCMTPDRARDENVRLAKFLKQLKL